MKQIPNQVIIKIAKMCKDGKTIEQIQKATGVKAVTAVAIKLRKAGANIPLPKKGKGGRDWSELAKKINKI